MDCAVVAPAQHREIRKRRRPALGPVADVMALAERRCAARKAATAVPMVQRATYRWRNRPGSRTDFDDAPVRVVPHHDPGRIAREALRRYRGNVRAAVED